jgi:hypothetical protein
MLSLIWIVFFYVLAVKSEPYAHPLPNKEHNGIDGLIGHSQRRISSYIFSGIAFLLLCINFELPTVNLINHIGRNDPFFVVFITQVLVHVYLLRSWFQLPRHFAQQRRVCKQRHCQVD